MCPLQPGFDEDAYARYVVVKEPGNEEFCSLRTARAGVMSTTRLVHLEPSCPSRFTEKVSKGAP